MIERTIEKKLLWPAVFMLSLPKRKPRLPKNPKRILVIRLWAMGETILVLPMLRELRRKYPDAEITVLCTKKNSYVFHGQDYVDAIKTVWTKEIPLLIPREMGKYDLCIDTEPHFNISAILARLLSKFAIGYSYGRRGKLYDAGVHYNDRQHAVFAICDLLSPLGIRFRPKELVPLKWKKEDGEKAESLLEGLGRPVVGMHPGCGGTAPWREWPEERFAKLADGMLDSGMAGTVIITGTKSEGEKVGRIIRMMKNKSKAKSVIGIPPGQLFALISAYGLMVSNDTGPMHVSAAQGVPTIGLFGPNLPERFGPFPPGRNASLYHKEGCSPCINVHKGEFLDCRHGGKCMKKITVDEVFRAARKLLR
jgi:heptosyltransferase-2